MEYLNDIKKPSKKEQRIAMESYSALAATLQELHSENPEIEIEETTEKIKIPLKALKLLAKILKATSQGKPISVVPIATEMTTQAAAELLGCSRPHLVKLLESGEIPFTKVGRHRRVMFEDVMNYKNAKKQEQEQLLIDMMKSDEELGLYDS
ncbi:helix-turn-helix domain-containing protein [Kordia jejudonensis]|uniref:helix-turn-helix domain-containing protein n=1 Tax=Kordia jejudonensis TaxID=1348245 RepID=UPI0006299CE4|nr:helix-turn-helix domain-containing protein [Kordia jejudonensis]